MLSGAANAARQVYVSLDSIPYAIDTVTVVVYYPAMDKHDPLQSFDLIVDGTLQGQIIAEQPLRFPLKPGRHVLQAQVDGVTSKPRELIMHGGIVYFYKLRREIGTSVEQVYLDATPLIDGYSVNSHRPELH
jgi:hypothetical protein